MNIRERYPEYDYEIAGTSYAGHPRSGTAMFVTKKVEHLLDGMEGIHESLILIETGCTIPNGLKQHNAVIETPNPQLEYAWIANRIQKERAKEEERFRYVFRPEGYYISECARLGEDCHIEPGCVIGHGVTIGDRAVIHAGSVIRHAVIGDDFVCNENAVIGSDSFTMAEDENGDKIRIACLGSVSIGNHVEVGAHNHIAAGFCEETVLEDYVKLDALCYIAHDVHLKKNTVIAAGVNLAGHTKTGEHTYIGLGACVRNRITAGANSYVGMGAVVTKNVETGVVVVGNPARPFC